MKRTFPQPNCCHCGRFARWRDDQSTNFGDSTMVDPPDPDYYCRRCVRQLERRCMAQRRPSDAWIPARWMRRVARKLGYVRAGPPGAAWGQWTLPNDIPAGYVAQQEEPR